MPASEVVTFVTCHLREWRDMVMRASDSGYGGANMRKPLLLIAFLVGGVIGGILMPATWRARLSQPLVAALGNMCAHVPDS